MTGVVSYPFTLKGVRSISDLARHVAAFAARADLTDTQSAPIELVVEELAINALTHGGPGGDVAVVLVIERDRVSIEICDDGVAFNPLEAPAPDTTSALDDREIGGLGLHIVTSLAQEMSYKRVDGLNKVRIVLAVDKDG